MKSFSPLTDSNLRHQTRLACGLIPLLNMLKDRAVDTDAFLRSVGIRQFELTDPAFTISFEQELSLVGKALSYIPEVHGSLELARRYHLHNFSVLGLAIRSCATLAEIFDLIVRYPRMVWGVCETATYLKGENICFEFKAGENQPERFLLERDMASVKALFSEALSSDLKLEGVSFSHPAPADVSVYEIFFNCPVLFDQAVSELRLPLAELDKKVPTADPLSKEFYEAQCARISADIDQPFSYSYLIRDYLCRMTPMPDLSGLAVRLGIEPRTLQRLLAKEEKTFSAILKDVRYKRAADRLQYSDLSVEQIARELGFNDAVAFSHAFKIWSGIAPRPWRSK
jgi:AraC-like DNA-binding protein